MRKINSPLPPPSLLHFERQTEWISRNTRCGGALQCSGRGREGRRPRFGVAIADWASACRDAAAAAHRPGWLMLCRDRGTVTSKGCWIVAGMAADSRKWSASSICQDMTCRPNWHGRDSGGGQCGRRCRKARSLVSTEFSISCQSVSQSGLRIDADGANASTAFRTLCKHAIRHSSKGRALAPSAKKNRRMQMAGTRRQSHFFYAERTPFAGRTGGSAGWQLASTNQPVALYGKNHYIMCIHGRTIGDPAHAYDEIKC